MLYYTKLYNYIYLHYATPITLPPQQLLPQLQLQLQLHYITLQ